MATVDPPTTLSDASLLTATASGDRAAFGELVGRHIDLVHAVACRQVTDASAADDVTQAVFLVLRDRAGSVRATSLPAWLHRTTRYAAATANRSARRRRHWERAAAAARPEAIMPPVDSNPLLPLLDDAIGTLPTKDRAVVIDRYLRGRDLPSVAATLGATPAATQKRLERAIRQLRAILIRRSSRSTASGVTASAIAVVLSTSAPSPASAALVAAIRSNTFTTTATSVAKGALLMMLQKTIAITVAVALAVAGLVGGVGYGIARVHAGQGVGAAPARAMSVEHPDNAPAFVATLKNGVQIELIGLCEAPSAGRPWWRPDGSPLVERPYTGQGARDAIAPDGADWVLREIAYRQTVPTGTSVIRILFNPCAPPPRAFGFAAA